MAKILPFVQSSERAKTTVETPSERKGDLVSMSHIDLDTVISMVRMLRGLEDQSYLDRFNRAR